MDILASIDIRASRGLVDTKEFRLESERARQGKRIVHVITGLNDGGAEAVLFRLCTADRSNQHKVISLMDSGKYGPLLEDNGVEVMSVGMTRGRLTLSGLWRIWRELRNTQCDVVQTWMYHADLFGGVAARLAGIRNVCWGTHHTTLSVAENALGTIVVAWICARLSKFVPRQIICVAQSTLKVHEAKGYEISRMTVVPNGYDLSVFRPDSKVRARVRESLGVEAGEPVIGFVARYDTQKDHGTLLSALYLLSEAKKCPRCLLVGTGMDANNAAVVAQISEFGLNGRVQLLGRRDDVPAIMNALDAHVMSSTSEAFPNVLAEAMACGVPCVSTDVGDAALIVGDTGWIVPSRDPAALAEAIEQAMIQRRGQLWTSRQESSRERVAANFSIESMVEGYHSVWFGSAIDSDSRD